MKKINILKENREYNRIINETRAFHYKDYVLYVEKDTNDVYHFGFSVGKKIGNAVTRNKIKRQLKNILDQKCYQNNFNCIIIVKKSILNKSFQEKQQDLLEAMEKLKLVNGAK